MKLQALRDDWLRNRISLKSLFIVLFFRSSGWFANHSNLIVRIVGLPVRILYKIIVEFLLGVELPDRVTAGSGLAVYHGVGLVVNAKTRLGENVTLRQNTTIGSKEDGGLCPSIGDNVSVGANCVILGDIEIGSNSVIGAGAIITRSCPEGSIVYGHKAEVKPLHVGKPGDHV